MKEEGEKLCNAREVFPEEEKTASAKALQQECGAPLPPPQQLTPWVAPGRVLLRPSQDPCSLSDRPGRHHTF